MPLRLPTLASFAGAAGALAAATLLVPVAGPAHADPAPKRVTVSAITAKATPTEAGTSVSGTFKLTNNGPATSLLRQARVVLRNEAGRRYVVGATRVKPIKGGATTSHSFDFALGKRFDAGRYRSEVCANRTTRANCADGPWVTVLPAVLDVEREVVMPSAPIMLRRAAATLEGTATAARREPVPADEAVEVTLTNTGHARTGALDFTVEDPALELLGGIEQPTERREPVEEAPSRFVLDTSECTSLLPGQSCTFTVARDTESFFAALANDATLRIAGGRSGATDTVLTSLVELDELTHDFGDQHAGHPATWEAQLTNRSEDALGVYGFDSTDDSTFYYANEARPCEGEVAAGETCTVPVSYAPTALGEQSAVVGIITDRGFVIAGVTGTGLGCDVPRRAAAARC